MNKINKYRSNNSKRGFTIIELLIVIAIVAVLVVIVTLAYGNSQKNVKKAATDSELATIDKAVGVYHVENGGGYVYPSDRGELIEAGLADVMKKIKS